MLYIQPTVFKLPYRLRKLAIGLAILSILSRRRGGSFAILMAGIGTYKGIGIDLPSDSSLYIQITDGWGNSILPGIEKVPDALRKAGLAFKEEVQEIIRIGNVVGRQGDVFTTAGQNNKFILLAAAIPLVLVLGTSVLGPLLGRLPSSVAVTEALAPTAEAQIVAQDKDIEWEQSLAAFIKNGIGRSVQATKDGGYLVAGFGSIDYPVFFVLKAGPDGKILWLKTVGKKDEIRDKTDATLYPTADGGYLMAGYDKWQGNPDGTIHLLKMEGPELNVAWENSYQVEKLSSFMVFADKDGGFTLNMWSGHTIYPLKVMGNSAGKGEWIAPIQVSGLNDADEVYYLQQTEDGGFILAGMTTGNSGSFKDALLAKTDAQGKTEWRRTFGGDKSEEEYYALQTSTGEYILTGKAQPRDINDDDLYLIKVDATGNSLWEKTFGGSKNESGEMILAEADGSLAVLGRSDNGIYLLKTDPNGNLAWEKVIGDSTYAGDAFCQSTDEGYVITGSIFTGGLDAFLLKVIGK